MKASNRFGLPAAVVRASRPYILVDEASGERTVLWKRDPNIALRPADLRRGMDFTASRALLMDGHDTEAAAQAARWAREEKIPGRRGFRQSLSLRLKRYLNMWISLSHRRTSLND